MDNYFTRGGNATGTTYTFNEFCVPSNHDPDADTYQESFYHKSCWSQIAAHPKRPAIAPVGLPASAAPAVAAPIFRNGAADLRVMLVIDRSGSMSLESRMEFAKAAANIFVDLLRDGDSAGLVDFDNIITVDAPLARINNTTRANLRSAIAPLSPRGNTDIGGGLLAALGQITSQPSRSCDEIIVLLTDGDNTTGTPPQNAIPAIKAAGVTVFTVGLGAGISTAGQAALQAVASETGGRYSTVVNSFNLTGLFFQLVAESMGSGLLARAPLNLVAGQTAESQVLVEPGSMMATFGFSFPNASDQIVLTLRTPSGIVISQSSLPTGAGFVSEPNLRAIRIAHPESGTWTIIVSAVTVTSNVVQVLASNEHDGTQLNASVGKEMVTFPEPIQLQAVPQFNGQNVMNVVVIGRILRPDGSEATVTLFDDGDVAHGDVVAQDGVYSNRFESFRGDGTYNISLTAQSDRGVSFSGESLFASFSPPSSTPTPAFNRVGSASVVVVGTSRGS